MSGVTIQGYDEFESIGSGGFSEVFEARQADLNRRVAVKVIKPAEAGFVDRSAFAKECQSMGAVSNHPNIVTLYTHGFTDEGQPYLAMELYEETLLDRLRRSERLPVDQVIEVGIALAAAIERAHDDGIIHCDIKPQNVFFSEYGEPALGDFGIAALETGPEGRQSVGVTLHYAAPEVLDDAPPSEMSDVYSLGATLYTALVGHQPFRVDGPKESAETIRQRVLNDPVPPITEQSIPPRLADLISQMLAKDPNARPQSAAEIQRTLQRLQRKLRPPDLVEDTVPRAQLAPTPAAGSIVPPPLDAPTVARKSAPPTAPIDPGADDLTRAITETPEADAPTSGRALIATMLAGVVVLSAVIAILLLGGEDDSAVVSDEPELNLTDSTIAVPTVPSTPGTPTDIEFEVDEEAREVWVRWTEVQSAARYEVIVTEQVAADDGTVRLEERPVTSTNEPEHLIGERRFELDGEDSSIVLCAQVRAVDEGGRTSPWSANRCF